MSTVVKRLAIALIAAVAGYLVLPSLNLAPSNLAALFAAGLFLGVIIGSLPLLRAADAQTATASASTPAQVPGKRAHPDTAAAAEGDNRKTVFVGNLAYRASPRQLRELFEPYGIVHSVRIATDRQTRKPRGFGFVEMSADGASLAISALNGSQLCNRALNLSEAKQTEPRF